MEPDLGMSRLHALVQAVERWFTLRNQATRMDFATPDSCFNAPIGCQQAQ